MFRIDYKTGRRIYGEDDLNTSTVPHKLAKMRSKTGNYNKGAEAARKMFPHLAVTKDPESREFVLPVKDAVYPIVEPVKPEKVEQGVFKKPEHVACDSSWKTFGDVEQLLVVGKPESEEGEGNSQAGDDMMSTRATGKSIPASLSEDPMEEFHSSGEECEDSEETVKKPRGRNVAAAAAVEEPEEMELGADAANIAGAARAIAERTRTMLMEGRDAKLDFTFIHEKDLREKTYVFEEAENEFNVKYVDYYFLGEDPRDEFRHLANRKCGPDDDGMMGNR